jgi:hypothetical protein
MKEFVQRAWHRRSALAAAAIILGFVADATAYPPRRGGYVPPPAPVDSTPMIDGLNKALKALDLVDRDYDGHRDKAIHHIHAAIHDLAVPGAKPQGKSNANAARSGTNGAGKDGEKGAAAQADAEAHVILRKALDALFAVHHKLKDNASTRGRIHADAQVRIAIQELVDARKLTAPEAAKAAAKPATTPSTPAKPATTPASAARAGAATAAK